MVKIIDLFFLMILNFILGDNRKYLLYLYMFNFILNNIYIYIFKYGQSLFNLKNSSH